MRDVTELYLCAKAPQVCGTLEPLRVGVTDSSIRSLSLDRNEREV